MEHYDVVVVGAAAGAVAARAAALAGARVLLVERSPHRPARCTGLVGPRTLDLLGLPAPLVLRGIRAVRVCAPGGGAAEFRAQESKGYVLDRSGLDRWLLERAGEAGVDLQTGLAAVGMESRILRTRAGPVRFGVLIAADGAASAVRRWAALPPPEEILVGVQARIEASSATDQVEVQLGREVAPGGFAWVVPAEEGTMRVGLITSHGRAALPLLSQFLVQRFPGKRVLVRESGLVPVGPPSRTVGDRVVLVGDAAAQVKPLSGGGILFGAISARIAGEVAAHGASALQEYEVRWGSRSGTRSRSGFVHGERSLPCLPRISTGSLPCWIGPSFDASLPRRGISTGPPVLLKRRWCGQGCGRPCSRR